MNTRLTLVRPSFLSQLRNVVHLSIKFNCLLKQGLEMIIETGRKLAFPTDHELRNHIAAAEFREARL